MELKNGMTVIAPCDGDGTIKKGDEFVISNVETLFYGMVAFELNDEENYCLLKGCAHINGKNWIIKQEKMNLLKLLIETSGLNQAKFAEKVGRKPQHISRQIKSGGGMHTKMFFEYAEILGIEELKFDYKNTKVTLNFK